MKSIFISGSPRANVGKKDAKATRNQGLVPCVLYGGKEQIHFSATESQFKSLIYTPEVHTVDIELAGNKYKAILQETQYHPISDKLLHVDFLQVIEGKPITIAIPVKVKGNSPGVRAGGKLMQKARRLKVRADFDKLPDFIEVDISEMEIGSTIKIQSIKADGLTFLEAPNVVVVAVVATRNTRQAEQDAAKK
jgi:large subunit ribosomal protein L25